jgi:hypothetical protein
MQRKAYTGKIQSKIHKNRSAPTRSTSFIIRKVQTHENIRTKAKHPTKATLPLVESIKYIMK